MLKLTYQKSNIYLERDYTGEKIRQDIIIGRDDIIGKNFCFGIVFKDRVLSKGYLSATGLSPPYKLAILII